jgi:glycosyltransferase involved in cell wall biosynthesis
MEKISVIVTTQNRQSLLEESLTAVFDSANGAVAVEVIIVDDGSSDETPQCLQDLQASGKLARVIRNDIARGPATARNQGIKSATGEYTLIMGDDVIFFPEAIPAFLEHIDRYGLHNASVIGNIMPHPDGMTAFEHWSCHGGSQFGHYRIPQERRLDAGDEFFYTSNIVSPTALLRANPFDESFPYPRYEDRELGYRLRRKLDHKVHYLPEAKSYHKHRLPLNGWLNKFDRFAWSALYFCQLYPHDAELAVKLGVTAAKGMKRFNFDQLAISVAVINRLHRHYFDSGDSFGLNLMRDQVADAFRILQEFFRTGYLRKHLRLPPMHDNANQMDGNVAMERLLAMLEKTV